MSSSASVDDTGLGTREVENDAQVPIRGCEGSLDQDEMKGQCLEDNDASNAGSSSGSSKDGNDSKENERRESQENPLARPAALDTTRAQRPRGRNPTRHLYLANCGKGKGDSFDSVWATLREASKGAPVEALHVGEEGVSYASFSTTEIADDVRQALTTATNWLVHFADFRAAGSVQSSPPGPKGPPTPESVESTAQVEVPGLTLIENFVTEEEAAVLLAAIDERKWDRTIKRRVQHYGHAFDYAKMALAEEDGSIPALPPFAVDLAARISQLSPKPIDQLTCNEYEPGIGIGFHVDAHSSFEDGICGVSLGSGIVMEWRKPRADGSGKETKAVPQKNVWLPERSLFILTGEARYAWQHGIPCRKTDCISAREVIPRQRRVSMTFRAARFRPCQCPWPLLCDSQNPEAHVLPSRITGEEWGSGHVNGNGERISPSPAPASASSPTLPDDPQAASAGVAE